ncbi:MAG TPA: glycosyltransferase family 9 protein [Candidatus Kapabacteria bacterium]|jgi:ADP-heptose:LPS heptosyltransferase
MDSPERILVVRLGGIGDVICTLPALEALRAGFPNAFIGYAVEEPAYDIVHNHPALDTVHVFRRRDAMKKIKSISHFGEGVAEITRYKNSLRSERYDLALDFQRNLKGAVHCLLSGATRQVGFTPPTAREFNQLFHSEKIDPAPAVHWVDKFLAMSRAVGGKMDAACYRLPDAPESREFVQDFLQKNNISRYIAMHPGASAFDPARLWEPERFGSVAQAMEKEFGMRTVVTWGRGERERANRVIERSHGSALLFPETKSILDLSELYKGATIYIGSDTGPMHLATAVGLQSIVLFGSGNPAAYGPRSAGSVVVSKMNNTRLQPLSEISVENVMQAVRDVFSQS